MDLTFYSVSTISNFKNVVLQGKTVEQIANEIIDANGQLFFIEVDQIEHLMLNVKPFDWKKSQLNSVLNSKGYIVSVNDSFDHAFSFLNNLIEEKLTEYYIENDF